MKSVKMTIESSGKKSTVFVLPCDINRFKSKGYKEAEKPSSKAPTKSNTKSEDK